MCVTTFELPCSSRPQAELLGTPAAMTFIASVGFCGRDTYQNRLEVPTGEDEQGTGDRTQPFHLLHVSIWMLKVTQKFTHAGRCYQEAAHQSHAHLPKMPLEQQVSQLTSPLSYLPKVPYFILPLPLPSPKVLHVQYLVFFLWLTSQTAVRATLPFSEIYA